MVICGSCDIRIKPFGKTFFCTFYCATQFIHTNVMISVKIFAKPLPNYFTTIATIATIATIIYSIENCFRPFLSFRVASVLNKKVV